MSVTTLENWLNQWQPRTATPPLVMGILNVTPDSFSDGGNYSTPAAAAARAAAMIAEGADIIDVGGESTRPGAFEVSAAEQLQRVIPVIEGIRAAHDSIPISIDTRSAAVARAALRAGANMINDVSAMGDDPEMAEAAAEASAAVLLMHRRGTSVDMQRDGGPTYGDLIGEISEFLEARMEEAVRSGIARHRILLDPGIGFGKRVEDNLRILGSVPALNRLGRPVVIGASRKQFIGTLLSDVNPEAARDPLQRVHGSLACAAAATLGGAAVLRVHEVRLTVEVARICAAVQAGTDWDRRS